MSRAAGLTLILPLVLTRFSTPEIAVWYLLASIISLQQVADAGFAPTFQRVFAYAMGGAANLHSVRPLTDGASQEPNLALVARIWSTAQLVYNRLSILAILVLGSLGTWALVRPIRGLVDVNAGWMAWAVVLIGTAIVIRGNSFAAYLQGANEIALVKRWEALTALGGTLTSVVVLLAGGRLVALALAVQSWAVLNVFRDWLLARRAQRQRFGGAIPMHPSRDREVLDAVWPSAWRSAVGIGMSRGILYASGLVYAQVADATAIASYLLALRLMQAVSEFSQAPFYSKLPRLAQLFSVGRSEEQLALAQKGMRMAFWAFVIPFVLLGVAGSKVTILIHSHAPFVPQLLWALIGLAFFLERYGAMHLQLFSTSNRIVWHIANGVSGTINIASAWLLFPRVGVYAFPLALVLSMLGFYCWYSAMHAYRAFGMNFFRFERGTSLAPLTVVLVYLAQALISANSFH